MNKYEGIVNLQGRRHIVSPRAQLVENTSNTVAVAREGPDGTYDRSSQILHVVCAVSGFEASVSVPGL